MSTLAIFLVVYSSRGHQLVFQYPPREEFAQLLNDADPFSPLADAYRTLSELTPSFLADLLSPKAALCDKKFQVGVDQVTFVGLPTLLTPNRPTAGAMYARMIRKAQLQRQAATLPTPGTPPSGGAPRRDISRGIRGGSALWQSCTSGASSGLSSPSLGATGLSPHAPPWIPPGPLFWADLPANSRERWLLQSVGMAAAADVGPGSTFGRDEPLGASTETTSRPSVWLTSPDCCAAVDSSRDLGVSGGHVMSPDRASDDSGVIAVSAAEAPPVVGNATPDVALTLFHVALAVGPSPGSHVADGAAVAERLYRHVLLRLTIALKFEQLKRDYVHSEARLLAAVRENALRPAQTAAPSSSPESAGVPAGSPARGEAVSSDQRLPVEPSSNAFPTKRTGEMPENGLGSTTVSQSELGPELKAVVRALTQTLEPKTPLETIPSVLTADSQPAASEPLSVMAQMLAQSSLARALVKVYHSTVARTPCQLQLNDYLQVDLCPQRGGTDAGGMVPLVDAALPSKAVLLLRDDAAEALKALPPGTNPLLADVVRVAAPTRTVGEMSRILGVPLAHVAQAVSHLVFWELARVIERIRRQSVYAASRSLQLQRVESLEPAFAARFPGTSFVSLHHLLAHWGRPVSLDTVLSDATRADRAQSVQLTAWLLRHRLIEPLRVVAQLRAGRELVQARSARARVAAAQHIVAQHPGDPCAAHLLRLAPHLDGRTSLGDMAHFAQLSRRQVSGVFSIFDEHLVTALEPEPSVI